MDRRRAVSVAVFLLGILAWERSEAAGLLVPTENPSAPLAIKSQRVTVTIDDTVATTEIIQVFHNRLHRPLEAVYVFPMPEGASVASFSMWVRGKEIKGEVMERQAARRHYDDITRQRLDPALLEHMRDNKFKISVSPVPPRGDQKIKLVYTETVPYRRGILRYTYPLHIKEAMPTQLMKDFSLTVKVGTHKPILHVHSPTHPVDVRRRNAYSATVGVEEPKSALDRDFTLLVSLKEKRSGVTVLTYRHSAEEDGYFMALVTAPETAADRLAKDIVFVLDTSGSMKGEKIVQAKQALIYCIENLHPKDRLNVIRFSTSTERLSTELVTADRGVKARAVKFVQGFRARGGTNIEEALAEAIATPADPKRPFAVLFLTDGLPTVGEENVDRLLGGITRLQREAKAFPRIHVFGVGSDVNTRLLDSIAEISGASRAYVEPGEEILSEVTDLYDRIRSPLLADLKLATPGINSYDIFPRKLPNLYEGRQLVVTGRYKGGGPGAVEVTAAGAAGKVRLAEDVDFPMGVRREETTLPRLWAMRKIGTIADEIRLKGQRPELVEEMVDLGKKHGVVTPYTSYLVLESERMYRDRGIKRATRRSDGTRVDPRPRVVRRNTGSHVITTDLAKKKEPEYDEKKLRNIFKNTEQVEVARVVENPVFVHEAARPTDHFETENDMDARTARGQEDAITDIPLGGTGIVGNIGVGGGGAGCFGYRTGGGRKRAVAKFGGSRASESAVDAALRWLARHQEPEGNWSAGGHGATSPDGDRVSADTMATGLASLAFLGAGHTERAGKFRPNVRSAVKWLMAGQSPDGLMGSGKRTADASAAHAVGGLSLAEAYGMARNPLVGRAAQKAVDHSIQARQREYLGWGSSARGESSMDVTAWYVLQLKSARVAGLKVDGKGFAGAISFVDSVTGDSEAAPGRASMVRRGTPSREATAMALVCRMFMGRKRSDPAVSGAAETLCEALPDWKRASGAGLRHWYFGTMGLFHVGGRQWKAWNSAVRDMLVRYQRRGGDADGSWDPAGAFASRGGRVSSTALGAMTLEVYYRYLPLYGRGHSHLDRPSVPAPRAPRTPDAYPVEVPPAPETGAAAVRRSEEIRRLREADNIGGAR